MIKSYKKNIITIMSVVILLYGLYYMSDSYNFIFNKIIVNDAIGIIDGNISKKNANITYSIKKKNKSIEPTHGDKLVKFLNSICDNPSIYYYDASNEDDDITTEGIINGLEWMVKNNVEKVNISLSSKEYSDELNNWISLHKDVIKIYASYNNLINSYDYPAMYDYVIASGSNKNIEYKDIDFNYKKIEYFLSLV